MKIGLWADNVATFPSLPLMKLSAYCKARGDSVKIIDDFTEKYDLAYCSKTFNLPQITKIPLLTYYPNADKVIYGGTGFAITIEGGKENYTKEKDAPLPREIEHIYPDYGLYPSLTKNTAYGFLTRGCPNNCGFCVVGSSEGVKSVTVAETGEFWRGQRNIKLLDANLLACKDRETLIKRLADTGARVDFTQGLDARFIDDETAARLCKVNIKMVHFAFDLMKNETAILRGLSTFARYFDGDNGRKCKVYILTNYNTSYDEDWYRVRKVMELGYQPDIRIYQKGTHAKYLTDLSRWANNHLLYRSCAFRDYVPRNDGKSCGELYADILRRTA
jgi:hypothetical protein